MREWLKKLREEANLTQQQVAQELGVTQTCYSMIESGQRQIDMGISFAEKFAVIFGVSIDYILENEKEWLKQKESA